MRRVRFKDLSTAVAERTLREVDLVSTEPWTRRFGLSTVLAMQRPELARAA